SGVGEVSSAGAASTTFSGSKEDSSSSARKKLSRSMRLVGSGDSASAGSRVLAERKSEGEKGATFFGGAVLLISRETWGVSRLLGGTGDSSNSSRCCSPESTTPSTSVSASRAEASAGISKSDG